MAERIMRFRSGSIAAIAIVGFAGPLLSASETSQLAAPGSRTIQIDVRSAVGQEWRPPEGATLAASELAEPARELRVPVAERILELELPSREAWRLCLEAEGWWAPCRTGSATTDSASFPIWPAASLAGRLRFTAGTGNPDALKVTVGPPPGPGPRGPFEDSEVSCSVDEESRFACSVPATDFYVAVRVSGYVSRYFWDLDPAPGGRLDLGVVSMEPGASLSGMVDLTAEGVDAERISARLSATISAGAPTDVAASVDKDTKTSDVGPRGFFQFAGLKPGSYMLEVTHPSFATTRVGPFEVFAGKETELNAPIVLQPPIDLSLVLTPSLSPQNTPWQARISRARDWSAGSDLVFSGPADAEGQLRVERQSPGRFHVFVTDDQGNRFHSQEVRIDAGGDGFVLIDVPLVEVQGTLRLGELPLAGTLVFGGSQGSLRARMVADDEGFFAGALPKAGEWEVEIEAAEPAIRTVRRVEVSAGSDGIAEIDVELPNTELAGRVVDPSGRAVEGAEVKVDSTEELVHVRTRTDDQGRFSVRAFPEGGIVVGASARIGDAVATSMPAQLSLQEDIPTPPLEIVLLRLNSISGQVSSTHGTVPGARISIVTLDLPIPSLDFATSDANGRFTVRVPDGAGLLEVTLLPPGGFLTTATLPAVAPLELQAAIAGGDLTARVGAADEVTDEYTLWLHREGVLVHPALLFEWARSHGIQSQRTEARYSRLAEGRYRVCAVFETARQEALRRGESWQAVAENATRCAEGLLTAGGTLDLVIP